MLTNEGRVGYDMTGIVHNDTYLYYCIMMFKFTKNGHGVLYVNHRQFLQPQHVKAIALETVLTLPTYLMERKVGTGEGLLPIT